MTMMIPEYCIDKNPVAESLYQNLYNQLGPDYKVIQYIKSSEKKASDSPLDGSLFWIQFKQQSLFLYLSNAPADCFDSEKSDNEESLKNKLHDHPEITALIKFQTRLTPPQLQDYKAHLTPFLMIFSNIDKDKLNIRIKSLGIYLLGKDKLAYNGLGDLIYKLLGKPLSPSIHHYLRCEFNPELAIFSHQVDNSLLDNEQEAAVKVAMQLSKNNRRSEHLNLHGVNGDINSGKSEVVLQRAKLINQSTKESNGNIKKVLILSPNEITQTSLNKRYYTLFPTDKKTEILSLSQWCDQLLKPTKTLIDKDHVEELISRSIRHRLEENDVSLAIFCQELDFILGRIIFYESDYLKAKRLTQSYNLTEKKYKHIWKGLLTIKNELALRDSILSSELPQLLWESLQKESFKDQYDHILIDDAHLFPPIAFDLIKKAIKPDSGQLFIAQDPNQRIANACSLWKDTGLDLRGHSVRLMNSYQINPYILNAASSFYLHRLPDDMDKTIHRNLPKTSDNPMPQLLHFHSSKDEENRLLDKIKKLIHKGTALEDILLISVLDESIKSYKERLNQTLDIPVKILKGANNQSKGLGITSLLYAHGQKASYVFIIGLHHIYEAENSTEITSDERKALLIENTHKLTMAMTCAKKELTLFITAKDIPRDFISPHIDIPSVNSESYAEVLSLHG